MTYARRIFSALLLLAAACAVDEGGNIPCADDSSCPKDYPKCDSGKCVAGTPTAGSTAFIQVVSLSRESVRSG